MSLLERTMWIEISAPGDRRLRMQHASIDDLKSKLEPGYSIVGTVSLCNDKGEGGFVSPLNGPSLMGALLEAHGDELLTWLKQQAVMFGVETESGVKTLYAKPEPVTLSLDTSEITRMVQQKIEEFYAKPDIPTSDVNAG